MAQPAGAVEASFDTRVARLQQLLANGSSSPAVLAEVAAETCREGELSRRLHELVNPLWPAERRIDFVIAGAMKAGTTALNWYLNQHPSVGTAFGKEAHFFDFAPFFGPGGPNYDWYHAHFAAVASRPVLGEATPTYLCDPETPGRLRSYNPNLRIIVLLRHPVERLFSHYTMNVRSGAERLPLLEALEAEPDRLEAPSQSFSRFAAHGYLQVSRYAAQLRALFEAFDRSQVLAITTDDLFARQGETVHQVSEFLDLRPWTPPGPRLINQQTYRRFLQDEERQRIREQLRDDLAELEELLGRELVDWRR